MFTHPTSEGIAEMFTRRGIMKKRSRSFAFSRYLLLVILSVLCLFFSGAVTVSAAAKLVPLKNGMTYTAYDVTADGVKDKLSYNAKTGKVSVNGKSQKLFAGVKDASRVRVFYYSLNKNNTFILVEYAKSKTVKSVSGFRYSGGRFKKASEPMGAYNSCSIGKLSGNNLVLYTGPSSGAVTLSFTGIAGKPFEYMETYKINTTKHMIVRGSNYGKIRSSKSYYYATNKMIRLSTSGKTFNTAGPVLEYGTKVTLKRVYFSYSGVDASKGSKIYELSFDGKTGWMKEAKARQFLKADPLASKRTDFFKEVVEAPLYGKKSVNEGFEDFVKKTGAQKSDEDLDDVAHVYTGSHFTVYRYYGAYDPIEEKNFGLINSGNKLISCAGVTIGMTESEAVKTYESVLRELHKDDMEPINLVNFEKTKIDSGVCLTFSTGFLEVYEYERYIGSITYDEIKLTIKDGRVTAYEYEQFTDYSSED